MAARQGEGGGRVDDVVVHPGFRLVHHLQRQDDCRPGVFRYVDIQSFPLDGGSERIVRFPGIVCAGKRQDKLSVEALFPRCGGRFGFRTGPRFILASEEQGAKHHQ